mgnify:CR=1 FL=1
MNKIFLLGVGAQRSGTTWFSDSLNTCSTYAKGLQKAYHVFDTEPHRFAVFGQDVDQYLNYFSTLASSIPSYKIFSDICPSYCTMDTYTLSFLQQELKERGFHLKVVFLMRDPVTRARSSLLHLMNSESYDKEMVKKKLQQTSNYISTITNIDSILRQEDILYQFYEEMFDESFTHKVSKFLEDDSYAPDFSKKLSGSPVGQVDWKYDDLSKVYSFVKSRFGRIPAGWKNL